MLYLVKCEVTRSYYMSERNEKPIEYNHIVEANSEKEAEEKVKKHYEKQDSEYSVTHWVNIEYANPIIV